MAPFCAALWRLRHGDARSNLYLKKKKKERVNSHITGIQRRAHLEVVTHAETGEYVVDMCACTQLCTSPMKSFLNIYNSPFKYKELNSYIEYFNRNGGLCGITQLNLE